MVGFSKSIRKLSSRKKWLKYSAKKNNIIEKKRNQIGAGKISKNELHNQKSKTKIKQASKIKLKSKI